MSKKKLSIITVCRNAEKEIGITLESVKNQTCIEFNYYIIDGKSTDGTLEIVRNYISNTKEINVILISEPDSGIFNAMNKGINKTEDQWVLFLNAGDSFHSNSVVSDALQYLNDGVDFVYGDACFFEKGFPYMVQSRDISTIVDHIPFTHQSIFNRTNALRELLFYNEKYKMCADYDLYLRAYISGYRFLKANIVVSNYVVEGATYSNQYQVLDEIFEIKKNVLGSGTRIGYIISKLRIIFSRSVKRILPPRIIQFFQKIRYE